MPEYKLRIVVEGKDNASGPLGNVASSLQRIGEFAAGSLLASGVRAGGRAIVGMGREALGAVTDFERLEMSLETLVAREALNTGAAETMTAALAGAGEQTQDLIRWIEDLAVLSPFNQSDIAKSFRLTMAYGFTADEAQRLTTVLTDFAAGSGATGDAMNRIGLALGQIKARGKLAGQEIMQLTEAGIPVRQILADAFNVTTAELEEMQRKGIDANVAIQAIIGSLERDFAGAAERQAGTFSGLISSMEDLRELGLRDFFGPMFQEAQPYLQAFVDTVTDPSTRAAIQSLGEAIGSQLGGALTTVSAAVGSFTAKWQEAEQSLGKSSGFMQTLLKMLGVDYEVELNTVFTENPPPLPETWAANLNPLELKTEFPLEAPPLPEAFGASLSPVDVTAKVVKTETGPPLILRSVVNKIDISGATLTGDATTSGETHTWSWGPNYSLQINGVLQTITLGDATIKADDAGLQSVKWNGNGFDFTGSLAELYINDNILKFKEGGKGFTWNGQAFEFPGIVTAALTLKTGNVPALVQKLFTPGSFSDTELAISVKASLAAGGEWFKKLFTPGAFADTEWAISVKAVFTGVSDKILALFGLGESSAGQGGGAKASLAIGDDGSLGRLEAAVASLLAWPTSFAGSVTVGVLAIGQELDRIIGNIQAPGWVTSITGLFDGTSTITIPEFTWPELPAFTWPEEIWDFAWPPLPAFTWPTLPTFNWPTLPIFSWPNVGKPVWPSPGEILARLSGLGGVRTSQLGGGGGGGGSGSFNALGSNYWQGGMTMVGEYGPELVNLPRGSRINNAFETQRMLGGGAPVVVNVNVERVSSDVDVQSMAYRVADVIQRRQRAFA